MSRIYLASHPSGWDEDFEAGPFTVLFGKNNVGKTNLLEAIYTVLAPQLFRDGDRRVRGLRREYGFTGAIYVDLERGLAFDDVVLALIPEHVDGGPLGYRRLPPDQVGFGWSTLDVETLPNPDSEPELWFVDFHDVWGHVDIAGRIYDEERDELYAVGERTALVGSHPGLRPLFLGWDFQDFDQWVTTTVARLSTVPDRWQVDGGNDSRIPGNGSLEAIQGADSERMWRVRPEVSARLDQLVLLANDLLPDFLDGSLRVEFDVPTDWGEAPLVRVRYQERVAGEQPRPINEFGRGASRWLAIAVQVALHIMESDWVSFSLPSGGGKAHSGSVLLVDEPEAHLHPSAVASVVRWCQRLVDCGFQVVAASHHDEFLRGSNRDTRFVHVSRGVEAVTDALGGADSRARTRARTVLMTATPVLQDLAAEVGMHPAVALSLHRGILFVEGTLDKAMLEEYAGPALDAAGVVIIPMHGTKNLEGLIDGEFTAGLGIKAGILTDKTDVASLWERSNKKRSGEEKKVARLLQRFQDQGLPLPTAFGIPEDDLLFALPAESIRVFLEGPFPGWEELRDECRKAEGRGPSDSVDWKAYAENRYRLPISTEDGVRRVVRGLDLAGVEIPSLQKVTAEIIEWANSPCQ
jgi:energy-coupling factor transporter ATP-binding protein EcfA2